MSSQYAAMKTVNPQRDDIPLGSIEPHAPLLEQPAATQRLYKISRIPHLLDMLEKNYLHFQRVDSYTDDCFDGEQSPLDRPNNEQAVFHNDPAFNMARYFDLSRSRTYACCFSLENSDYIWNAYGKAHDSVCLVFEFGKLRQMLSRTMQDSIESNLLQYGDCRCKQIFSINYGLVKYIEYATQELITTRFPNPIQYTFLKDKPQYQDEQELRIALSALGMGHFVLMMEGKLPFHLLCNLLSISERLLQPVSSSSFCMGDTPRLDISTS